jgi:hypothetical protein
MGETMHYAAFDEKKRKKKKSIRRKTARKKEPRLLRSNNHRGTSKKRVGEESLLENWKYIIRSSSHSINEALPVASQWQAAKIDIFRVWSFDVTYLWPTNQSCIALTHEPTHSVRARARVRVVGGVGCAGEGQTQKGRT